MASLFVQFADDTEEVIVSYFPAQQDPKVYPHQGTVDTSDPRWRVFWEALPDSAKPYLPAPD